MRSTRAVVFCVVLWFIGAVQAATDVQKRAAIDKGLEYLAQTQQASGKWVYSGGVGGSTIVGPFLMSRDSACLLWKTPMPKFRTPHDDF